MLPVPLRLSAIALVLIACSGDAPDASLEADGTGSASAGATVIAAVDACSIVPAAELERILGSAPAAAEPAQPIDAGGAAMRGCAWRTPDNAAGLSLQVRSGAQYRPDAAAFDRYADGMEENMGSRPRVQSVTGLGSAALWDQTNHVLLVRAEQPGHELSVQPYLSARVPMVELEQARALAEAALGRLP